MKLSDWAKKQGISYLTAYRWFKDGKLPIKAYQSDSGTIIVQDESENVENPMASSTPSQTNDVMSLILKKTVELSKSNAPIEDFAAYILSNFSLKLNSGPDSPRYSRNKPKPEEIQKHFQQFLKPKGEKPKPNMLVADSDEFDELIAKSELTEQLDFATAHNAGPVPEVQDLMKDFTAAIQSGKLGLSKSYGSSIAEGIVNRIELTPQSINYTDSTVSNTLGDSSSTFSLNAADVRIGGPAVDSIMMVGNSITGSAAGATGAFKPTQKEIDSVAKAMEKVANQLHAEAVKPRRGRKASKKK